MSVKNTAKTAHHETVVRRPVGTFVVLASVAVAVAKQLGVEITIDESLAAIAALSALLAKFHPKF